MNLHDREVIQEIMVDADEEANKAMDKYWQRVYRSLSISADHLDEMLRREENKGE